jgi:hypothetical protein
MRASLADLCRQVTEQILVVSPACALQVVTPGKASAHLVFFVQQNVRRKQIVRDYLGVPRRDAITAAHNSISLRYRAACKSAWMLYTTSGMMTRLSPTLPVP